MNQDDHDSLYHPLHPNQQDPSLPQWSANPQSPGDDPSVGSDTGYDYYGRHSASAYSSRRHHYHHSGRGHLFSGWVCYALAGIIFCFVMGMVLYSRYSLIDSMVEVDMLVANGQKLQTKLHDADLGIRKLHRKVSGYTQILDPDGTNSSPNSSTVPADPNAHPELYAHQRAVEEMQQLDKRLKESEQKARLLQQKVQALSKREAIDEYGHQTHRVEIELIFPDGQEGPTRFVIEMAPLEYMPHSVHFFLQMVSAQLLDGCSFILNALHVLKAAPLPYDGSSAANKARAFTRMGLESVAFKEYSPKYPHEQYTVGFAADGSPSFYINTEDNSEIHLGDPCFGKIVEGFDTVKRLEASPTRNGIWFEQRIGIKRATVLT